MTHAFLIMAHNNYPLLGRLLCKLDHPDNTIYLHIDAKSTFSPKDEAYLVGCCKLSKVILVERRRINWGGYSMIAGVLTALSAASAGHHTYYHYLSGVDFPIRPMQEIHDFFQSHSGCEFISVSSEDFTQRQACRHQLYHLLIEKCGRNRKNPLWWVEKTSLLFQNKVLHINRAKKHPDIVFKSGSCWFSLTHECVQYLLQNRDLIYELFHHSACCDEFYLQTILLQSPFSDRIAFEHGDLRYVDWHRPGATTSSPYTFTVDDYDTLTSSGCLFCRKVTNTTPSGELLIQKLEEL